MSSNPQLLPPSAFKVSTDSYEYDARQQAAKRPKSSDTQDAETETSQSHLDPNITNKICHVLECLDSEKDIDFGDLEDLEPICNSISSLKHNLFSKSEKIRKLEAAIHRTIPENLENRKVLSEIEKEKAELQVKLTNQTETVELLKERLECQSKVLSIQEKTLTTDARYQNMLESWRKKVLEMVVQKKMDEMTENRELLALRSQAERLETESSSKSDQIELLSNKNNDLIANLKLKEKHIQSLSNELGETKQSQLKYQQFGTNITEAYYRIIDNIKTHDSGILSNFDSISQTFSKYEERIEGLTQQLQLLQCLYREKEEFYSNKLENLLVQHTTPVPQSEQSLQTDADWESVTLKIEHLNREIAEQNSKIAALVTEKGILNSQISDVNIGKSQIQQEMSALRNELSQITAKHQDQVVELQKRETKAAIRAKHLDRELTKKKTELDNLVKEFRSEFQEQIEDFESQIETLKSENLSLRRAIRK